MFPVPESRNTKLHQLRGKRKRLWEQFEDNPNETHLALDLRIIDDQIAECNQRIHDYGDKTEDAEQEVLPEVEHLFLVLAVSHREVS